MIASDKTIADATKHLARHDSILRAVIENYGPCTIRPHKNYYQELVDSIISQQLSIKAAATIFKRFVALFGETFPSPEEILTKDIDQLRSAGLSRGKATYVLDLAQRVVDGRLKFDHLDSLSNDEVSKELIAVKGIGEWTTHMFMMFCMGRLDVLATGDLGIKNGIQKLYSLDHLPTPEEIQSLATKNNWHPCETVACWYVWKSLDNAPKN
jgi:DNA-3-methyladenine glycosylase II